jgi:hypothetical protein
MDKINTVYAGLTYAELLELQKLLTRLLSIELIYHHLCTEDKNLLLEVSGKIDKRLFAYLKQWPDAENIGKST